MADAKPIFFLHVPKTGGVSLRTLISYNFAEDRTHHVPDEESTNGEYARKLLPRFDFVHGHFSRLFIDGVFDEIRLMTILRKPEARLRSLYRFLQAQPPAAASDRNAQFRIKAAQTLSFEKFIAVEDIAVSGMIHSGLRSTLGASWDEHADTLERARELLRHTVFFGLCERFDESIALLCQTMGWPPASTAPRLNTTKAAAVADNPEVRAVLRERNQVDLELYDYASLLFEDRLAAARADRTGWRILAGRQRQRYQGKPTALGQVFDVARPILAAGWLNTEGTDTGRPWRFAGPDLQSDIYCPLEPAEDSTLWLFCHLPFFALCQSPRDLRIKFNDQASSMAHFEVAQGTVVVVRPGPNQFSSDGLQRLSFESPPVPAQPAPMAPIQDDRTIRFALTRIIAIYLHPAQCPQLTDLLQRIVAAMSDPGENASLSAAAQTLTKRIVDERLWQGPTSGHLWSTPLYQAQRQRSIEAKLTGPSPRNGHEALFLLFAADPAMIGELLFFLFPHIEPKRA